MAHHEIGTPVPSVNRMDEATKGKLHEPVSDLIHAANRVIQKWNEQSLAETQELVDAVVKAAQHAQAVTRLPECNGDIRRINGPIGEALLTGTEWAEKAIKHLARWKRIDNPDTESCLSLAIQSLVAAAVRADIDLKTVLARVPELKAKKR